MQTIDQLKEEARKLEEYLKQVRYENNKNAVNEAIEKNNITITDVKHMTPQQINENWEVIKKLNFNK